MKRFFILFLWLLCQIPACLSRQFRLFSDPIPPYLDFVNEDLDELGQGFLTLKSKPKGEMGIFANKTITKGATILKIPSHGIFASFEDYGRSYFFYEMVRTDHKDFLMGRLLCWKYLVKFGFLYDYFIREPHMPHLKDTALYWPDQEFEYFLNRSGFLNDEEANRYTIERQLRNIREINEPFLDKYDPNFPKEMFEQKELVWALSVVNQKSFEMSQDEFCILNGYDPKTFKREITGMKFTSEQRTQHSPNGYALIPYFDLFAKEEFQIELPQELQLLQKSEILKKLGIDTETLLINEDSFTQQPTFDLIFENIQSRSFRDYWVFENGTLSLLANRDYQVNEEITYFKGWMSNSKLLREYGYIQDENLFSGVSVRIYWGRYTNDEKKFIESIGIATKSELFDTNSTVFNFHHYQVNHKFVNFLRIFVMKAEELMPEFNETKVLEIIHRGRFKNAYLEMLLWYNYIMALDTRGSFRTNIVEDRIDLEQEIKNKNKLRTMILKTSIQQKFVIYKHLFAGWSKWVKMMHNDINNGFLKEAILHLIIEPDTTIFYSQAD